MIKIGSPALTSTRRPSFLVIAGFITILVIALSAGLAIGTIGSYIPAIVIGASLLLIILMLRQNHLAAIYIIVVHLYVDWYLGLGVVALPLMCLLIAILYLTRSPNQKWLEPYMVWIWVILLSYAILPAIHGLTRLDGFYYYFNNIVGAFLMFWLGAALIRDAKSLKLMLSLLAGFGTLIAIHTIIQTITGQMLFATNRYDSYLATISNYEIGSNLYRSGSFLVNPDSNGVFLGMMVLLPLGLFAESSSVPGKLFYIIETMLIFIALLFTYSTGGWASAGIGLLVFFVLIKQMRYRVFILAFSVFTTIVIALFFSQQLQVQIEHASTPNEYLLREGAWQTGIQVIKAFPLTGIGLGRYVYLDRAEPYRVLQQYRPLAHPHNSYIELAALGGIPLFIIFMFILVITFWSALRNWSYADSRQCSLMSGAIAAVAAMSFNGLVMISWTLPPTASIGWLILGALSSPFLTKLLKHKDNL